jgi:hypothetical protein
MEKLSSTQKASQMENNINLIKNLVKIKRSNIAPKRLSSERARSHIEADYLMTFI